jgi:hypothetical protein
MKRALLLTALASFNSWGDTACPGGKQAACLDRGDVICPASSRCVSESAVCYAKPPCAESGGYICASKYQAIVRDNEDTAKKYKALATENVTLRVKRLERKNCVLNASSLKDAKNCVR